MIIAHRLKTVMDADKIVRDSLEARIAPRAISIRPQTTSEGGYGGGGAIKSALERVAVLFAPPSRVPDFVYRVGKQWNKSEAARLRTSCPPPRAGAVTAVCCCDRAVVGLEPTESFS